MSSLEQRIATLVLVIGAGGQVCVRRLSLPSGVRTYSWSAREPKRTLTRRSPLEASMRRSQPWIRRTPGNNFVWSGSGRIERASIPGIPEEIAAMMRDVSTAGKLVE
jgi:hypothetical protein